MITHNERHRSSVFTAPRVGPAAGSSRGAGSPALGSSPPGYCPGLDWPARRCAPSPAARSRGSAQRLFRGGPGAALFTCWGRGRVRGAGRGGSAGRGGWAGLCTHAARCVPGALGPPPSVVRLRRDVTIIPCDAAGLPRGQSTPPKGPLASRGSCRLRLVTPSLSPPMMDPGLGESGVCVI